MTKILCFTTVATFVIIFHCIEISMGSDPTCLLPSHSGEECKTKQKGLRYHFNTKILRCLPFVHNGCGGNQNKFETVEDCTNSCETPYLSKKEKLAGHSSESHDKSECYLEPEVGPCRALIPMWFYSRADKVCKPFHYGGCRGNGNKFETFDECENSCSM